MRHECIIRMALIFGLVAGITVDLAFSEPRFGIIKGEVISANSGAPVAGVQVQLKERKLLVTTGAEGLFTFVDLPQGNYSIIASHPGFHEELVGNIVVRRGETTKIVVQLRPIEPRQQGAPSALDDLTFDEKQETQDKVANTDLRVQATPGALSNPSFESFTKRSRESSNQNYDSRWQAPTPEPDNSYVAPPEDMYFRDYGTNGFIQTARDRFSTFALDVDDASFTLARQYLTEGNMPPTSAIRVEEFVNHFDYGYSAPTDGRFRVFSEVTASPFDRRTHFMKIGVKAKEIPVERRKQLNLTLVIDVSGSMNYGDRFELVKKSLEMLIKQLDAGDKVGIVAYGSQAWTVLEPISAEQTRRIMKAINRLSPNGSTYAEAGLKLGFRIANDMFEEGHNNLVILCSDGVANVGQTSPDAIMSEIKRHTERGITLSTFGFGMGNYNDVLLERLALKGNGRYAYVNDLDQARTLFVQNIMANLQIVARDVKVQIEFNPGVVSSYRLLGYENRAVADHKFRDNRQDGGEVGSGDEVTALYEITLRKQSRSEGVATVFVRWKSPSETKVTELAQSVKLSPNKMQFASARPELKLAIIAAKFAELLKETKYTSHLGFNDLCNHAKTVNRQLNSEQTRELVSLIEHADNLTGYYGQYRDNDENYDDDDD